MGNYVIWGNCDPFWIPLILADLHNISQSLRPVAWTSPKKLLLQMLPVANWLGSSNITSATRRTEKPQEQLWTLGLLRGMRWPQSLLSSRELAGVIEPSDHLFKPYTHTKQTKKNNTDAHGLQFLGADLSLRLISLLAYILHCFWTFVRVLL